MSSEGVTDSTLVLCYVCVGCQGSLYIYAPYIITSALCILVLPLIHILPETRGQPLEDAMADSDTVHTRDKDTKTSYDQNHKAPDNYTCVSESKEEKGTLPHNMECTRM